VQAAPGAQGAHDFLGELERVAQVVSDDGAAEAFSRPALGLLALLPPGGEGRAV
jgi:hypothetical protein